ncbi:hypothetical protein DUT91_20190 [Phyllobacterium salinisoli]|uniref:Uncharacterized protein n=1 Tax=Phyllobacterium salinisoli TaxID=1899321 RepID=A0A368JY41_9HYPH|nr:hypothetical protein [Phyllobacterium salinisoli]RCS22047.1 hypothetical protein DUT91_20190 [Phyllobacterium salinisoli]
MSDISITYLTQDLVIQEGGLVITGTGPAGKPVHVTLKEYGTIKEKWNVAISPNGTWSTPETAVMPGTWNVDALLIADLPIAFKKAHVAFHMGI